MGVIYLARSRGLCVATQLSSTSQKRACAVPSKCRFDALNCVVDNKGVRRDKGEGQSRAFSGEC